MNSPAADSPPRRGRRALRRAALTLLTVIVLAIAIAAVAGFWFRGRLEASLPRLDGELALRDLDGPVTVARDAAGVATISGASRRDVAVFERAWAGLRPGSSDGLPILGRAPGVANLYLATGHFRAGFELSAGTAVVMADLLQGRATSVPLDAFRPDRPALAADADTRTSGIEPGPSRG